MEKRTYTPEKFLTLEEDTKKYGTMYVDTLYFSPNGELKLQMTPEFKKALKFPNEASVELFQKGIGEKLSKGLFVTIYDPSKQHDQKATH